MRAVLTTNLKFTRMQVYSLNEGSYSVGVDKVFIPFDPETDDRKDRKGSLFIHVQPFLIKHGTNLIVIDTGLGQFKNNKSVIHTNIEKAGFDPKDVNLVLMSHLHQDHASGMGYEKDGKYQLMFPNAEYVIQKREWEESFANSSNTHLTNIFELLQRNDQIHFVEGDGQLNENIRYELSGGHSEFHQVFHIEDEKVHYFFGGDEWPEPEQAQRKFAAKYDFDGKKAMELREQYANEAADSGWIGLFYHAKANSIAKIARQDDNFRIVPV